MVFLFFFWGGSVVFLWHVALSLLAPAGCWMWVERAGFFWRVLSTWGFATSEMSTPRLQTGALLSM